MRLGGSVGRLGSGEWKEGERLWGREEGEEEGTGGHDRGVEKGCYQWEGVGRRFRGWGGGGSRGSEVEG